MAVDDMTPFAGPEQVSNPQGANVLDQWGAALKDPNTRSALLSMGLQLMQPPSFGQNALGTIGQAIGAGGETVTRRHEEDLKDTLAQNRITKDEQALQLGRQRVDIGNRNATTREKALELRNQPGAISAKDFLRQQIGQNRAIEAKAKWEAEQLYKEANDISKLPGDISPRAAQFKGKSAGEIYRSLLADPEWKKAAVLSSGQATEATIPPANARVVGRTYQTPRGPLVWQGNGWAPAPIAPVGGTGSADDTEED